MRRLLLLLLAAAPAAADEALLPLAVGNAWTYRVSGQDDRLVVRAVRQDMIGQQACFLLEASLKDKVVGSEHVAFTKEGLCRFRVEKEDVEPPLCVLKGAGGKATRWTREFYIGPRKGTANFTVSESDVTVPAGKFKAVTVSAEINDGPSRSRTTVSYAAGVGIVKQVLEEGKRPPLVLDLEKFEKAAR